MFPIQVYDSNKKSMAAAAATHSLIGTSVCAAAILNPGDLSAGQCTKC